MYLCRSGYKVLELKAIKELIQDPQNAKGISYNSFTTYTYYLNNTGILPSDGAPSICL